MATVTTTFKSSANFKNKLAKICPSNINSIEITSSLMQRKQQGSYILVVEASINGEDFKITRASNDSHLWDNLSEMEATDYKYIQWQQKNAISLLEDKLMEVAIK